MSRLSVYLAARYSRLVEMNRYREELEVLGFEVTSRWLTEPPRAESESHSAEEWLRRARLDQEDVLCADVLVCFSESPGSGGNGGRHAELGMALALGRRVIVVGRREQVFHYLPEVTVVETWEAARGLLAQLEAIAR